MSRTSNRPSPRHARPVLRRGMAASGILSLALAGGAFTMANTSTATAATALQYKCKISDLGITYNTPWTVTMTTTLPSSAKPGASIPAPTITANVTTGQDASDQMRSLNIKTVEGTSTANYTFNGKAETATLTIPKTTIPASGNLTTVATGQGQAETAPTSGSASVKAGSFTAKLTTDTGFIINLACDPASSDTTIGSVSVGGATTPSPTTTAPSASPKPTSTSTSTPRPTGTPTSTASPTSPDKPAPTTTTPPTTTPATTPTKPADTPTAPTAPASPTPTAPAPTTSQPTQPTGQPSAPTSTTTSTAAPAAPADTTPPANGPRVETDQLLTKRDANVLGVGLTAAGVAALAGAAVLRRRDEV